MTNQNHSFHMVENSPWPLLGSLSTFFLVLGCAKWFCTTSSTLALLGFILILIVMVQWWRDVARESTLSGLHTISVYSGLKMGVIMFIMSEIMFFFSFFWAFFHASLSPPLNLGLSWPPSGIESLDPLQVPLLNTLVLLSSGVTITWAHHSLVEGARSESSLSLALTVVLALYFSVLQFMEYTQTQFALGDSSYSSTFFLSTGFHGLHVIIGSIFILVSTIRLMKGHFSSSRHVGMEAAIWYWHFVDVVWLFLYVAVYAWASGSLN